MSTKAVWFMIDLDDAGSEVVDINDKIDEAMDSYLSDNGELLEEAGLSSVKEILYDTAITDREEVRKKHIELLEEQWNMGWNLVNNTISEAGGLYIKNTWRPEKPYPDNETIDWWNVGQGSAILAGYPTYLSSFIIGWSIDNWANQSNSPNPFYKKEYCEMSDGLSRENIVLVQVLFRI